RRRTPRRPLPPGPTSPHPRRQTRLTPPGTPGASAVNPYKRLGIRQKDVLDRLNQINIQHPRVWVLTRNFAHDQADNQAILSLHRRGLIERGSAVLNGHRYAICRYKLTQHDHTEAQARAEELRHFAEKILIGANTALPLSHSDQRLPSATATTTSAPPEGDTVYDPRHETFTAASIEQPRHRR